MGGLCWDHTSQPWMGKTTHHSTSITTTMKAAAAEMHQDDIIQVWEILKNTTLNRTQFLRQQWADKASNFLCWLASTLHPNPSAWYTFLWHVQPCFSITAKDTVNSSHENEAPPALCLRARPNKALWTLNQSMTLRRNIIVDWKITPLGAFEFLPGNSH